MYCTGAARRAVSGSQRPTTRSRGSARSAVACRVVWAYCTGAARRAVTERTARTARRSAVGCSVIWMYCWLSIVDNRQPSSVESSGRTVQGRRVEPSLTAQPAQPGGRLSAVQSSGCTVTVGCRLSTIDNRRSSSCPSVVSSGCTARAPRVRTLIGGSDRWIALARDDCRPRHKGRRCAQVKIRVTDPSESEAPAPAALILDA
jgi:hypothetical protein